MSYLEHARIYSKAIRTAESRVRVLTRHFAGKHLDEIDAEAVRAFMAARLEEGASRPTVNRGLACLSAIFQIAKYQGAYDKANPVRHVKRFKESPGRTRWLTSAEFQRLLEAAPPHLQRLLYVAVHTGGRLSQLTSLNWEDVDLTAGVVYFDREASKNGRGRAVPMTTGVRAVLKAMGPGHSHEPVFTFRGRRFKSVRSSYYRARQSAGLPDVRFHDTRHSFASHATMNGLDPFRLQEYLGVSDPKLVRRYTHLSPEYLKAGAQFIGIRKEH